MRDLAPCGTWAAYKRHHKQGEIPCELCMEANRERSRQRVASETPDQRARRLERARANRPQRVTPKGRADSCAWCGTGFVTDSPNKKFCRPKCKRADARWRAKLMAPLLARVGRVRSAATGVVHAAGMTVAPSGGLWVWCPACDEMMSVDPLGRRCLTCGDKFEVVEAPDGYTEVERHDGDGEPTRESASAA